MLDSFVTLLYNKSPKINQAGNRKGVKIMNEVEKMFDTLISSTELSKMLRDCASKKIKELEKNRNNMSFAAYMNESGIITGLLEAWRMLGQLTLESLKMEDKNND